MFLWLTLALNLSIPSNCALPLLVERTGRESCWVKLHFQSQKEICVSKVHWNLWLNSNPGQFICEDSFNSWKTYSPKINSNHLIKTKEVRMTQYLKHFTQNKNAHPLLLFWLKLIHKIERIREEIHHILENYDSLGILRSLILNQSVHSEPLPFLRLLGFVHLISATGIHLYACLEFWNKSLKFIFSSLRFPLRIGLRISRITSLFICIILWILCGTRFGMLRPGIVILMRKIAELSGLRWKMGGPLFIAVFLDLIITEASSSFGMHSPSSHGRWIYALAVGGGVFWSRTTKFSHLGLAIGSWLLVALWEIWETGMIAIATPLLSLVTLPWVCLFIYPATLISIVISKLGFDTIAHFALTQINSGLTSFILLLTQMSLLKGNLWMIPRWGILIGFCLSTLICVFQYKKLNIRKVTIILFLISLSLRTIPIYLHQFASFSNISDNLYAKRIQQLDVGQGDSALIIGHQNGLVDTGSVYALHDLEWLHILSQNSIQTIHWVALTHLDEDHSGGLFRLARLVKIGCVALPESELRSKRGQIFKQNLKNFGIKLAPFQPKNSVNSDCVPFPTFELVQPKKKRNQNMGAIWIPFASNGFYLSAGDLDSEGEIQLVKWVEHLTRLQNNPQSSSRILKISHHGSRFSSSALFLKKISPTEAWISVGSGNSYGHPAVQVLNQLEKLQIPVRRTDRDGMLTSSTTIGVVPHQ